ncbi:uncharacterized protein LODBEIA_P26980 [Lodderomyces beijingensis]|uniref:Protein ECM5 n=1 Tax=Lodderomyces beijingensis TaxID=1775926 RepID=A0ABP0ZJZ2_9ASCO
MSSSSETNSGSASQYPDSSPGLLPSGPTSSFPKTSRFFDKSALPSLKSFEINFQNTRKQVWFNGQNSNYNYNPYSIPQSRTKNAIPIIYNNIPSKISIVQPVEPQQNEIPFLQLNEELVKDPMAVVDNLSEIGKKYGAIKLKLPVKDQSRFHAANQVNADLFWFQANKQLVSPKYDEFHLRLQFHKNLSKFLNSSSSAKNYIPHSYSNEQNSGSNSNSNSFTFTKSPMVDKRPLDLYKLFQSVMMRGGFAEVVNKKLWAQIGRELGYKGKIMTSLSSSLKAAYQKVLHPYELHLESENQKQSRDCEIEKAEKTIETGDGEKIHLNGKRSHQLRETPVPRKRIKIEQRSSSAPLIVGSAKQFKRRNKTKVTKGFLLNSPHSINIKPPNTFSIKNDEKKRSRRGQDTFYATIEPRTEVESSLRYTENNDDDTPYTQPWKTASVYTLRQFMEKDLNFQEHILSYAKEQDFPTDAFGKAMIKLKQLEDLYWKYMRNEMVESSFVCAELEMGKDIPSRISGSGFVRIGDDLRDYKNALNNYQVNVQNSKNSSQSRNGIIQARDGDENSSSGGGGGNQSGGGGGGSSSSQSKSIQAALCPWNLHNFSMLPNSILGALNDNDMANEELTRTKVNVGMTFSTENWSCEDHFTQLINYHFFGASKQWYFIPESEFEKFEKLIEQVSLEQPSASHINRGASSIDSQASTTFSHSKAETDEFLTSTLEYSVSAGTDIRSKLTNSKLASLVDGGDLNNCTNKENRIFKYNQESLITPELLDQHNIRYTATIQHPGEFVVKYPKTYSCCISHGFNFTEEVNFASSTWLKYAQEGEKWVSKQGVIPNFSFFKLLVSLAVIYDNGDNVLFNSTVFANVAALYKPLYQRELELRNEVRKLKNVKESAIADDSSADIVADDTLENVYPTRMVITENKSKQSIIISMESFLEKQQNPDVFQDCQIEMQTFYSDEKIRSFFKILSDYSVDFESWVVNFEQTMASGEQISLKQAKLLLTEGDKILSCINSTSNSNSHDDQPSQDKFVLFKSHLANLRRLTTSSTQFVEECQNLLSLKHQQRIRHAQGTTGDRTASLIDLINVVDVIPKLNLSCPEVDQILEFKNEIENFDKASRLLISKKSKTLQEFDDLISLGESFGLEIPSLEFMTRIRDRMEWLKIYDLIEKGVDPYADQKEVFTIDNLRTFHEKGAQILSENDVKLVADVEKILNESTLFNHDVTKLLSYKFVHDLDLEKIAETIHRFVNDKLFISIENYNELSKININLKLIAQYREKRMNLLSSSSSSSPSDKASCPELKQMLHAISESGLRFDTENFEEMLQNAETWVEQSWRQVEKLKIITTMNKKVNLDDVNQKLTMNGKFVEKLVRMLQKAQFSFSPEDTFEKSSYNLRITNSTEDPTFYCICREYEHGTMVECEHCNEWFHVQCVKNISDTNADSYKCPVCLLLESLQDTDQFLASQMSFSEYRRIYSAGCELLSVPVNEMEIMEVLIDFLQANVNEVERKLLSDQDEGQGQGHDNAKIQFGKLRFEVLKFYGSGFSFDLIGRMLERCRRLQPLVLAEDARAGELKNGDQPGLDPTADVELSLKESESLPIQDSILDSENPTSSALVNGKASADGAEDMPKEEEKEVKFEPAIESGSGESKKDLETEAEVQVSETSESPGHSTGSHNSNNTADSDKKVPEAAADAKSETYEALACNGHNIDTSVPPKNDANQEEGTTVVDLHLENAQTQDEASEAFPTVTQTQESSNGTTHAETETPNVV